MKKNDKNKLQKNVIPKRLIYFGIVISFILLCLIARLFYLQFINGSKLKEMAYTSLPLLHRVPGSSARRPGSPSPG